MNDLRKTGKHFDTMLSCLDHLYEDMLTTHKIVKSGGYTPEREIKAFEEAITEWSDRYMRLIGEARNAEMNEEGLLKVARLGGLYDEGQRLFERFRDRSLKDAEEEAERLRQEITRLEQKHPITIWLMKQVEKVISWWKS